MNHKQRLSMWVAIGAIVVLILFPPMYSTLLSSSGGHIFIFSSEAGFYNSIDYGQLLLPIAAVIIIAIGFIVTFRDKKLKK